MANYAVYKDKTGGIRAIDITSFNSALLVDRMLQGVGLFRADWQGIMADSREEVIELYKKKNPPKTPAYDFSQCTSLDDLDEAMNKENVFYHETVMVNAGAVRRLVSEAKRGREVRQLLKQLALISGYGKG